MSVVYIDIRYRNGHFSIFSDVIDYINSEEYLKFGKLLINKAKYFVAFHFLLKLQFTLPEYMLSPV